MSRKHTKLSKSPPSGLGVQKRPKVKNTGKEYETLIEHVMQGLAKLKGIQGSNFRRDVLLDAITLRENGEPFQHQIDLCWDFELAGEKRRVVFQAKDMAQAISRPLLMAFIGVISDLPDSPGGIMIASKGFDGPVVDYAKARNVGLYILNPLGQPDFVSQIPSLEIKLEHVQDGYSLRMLQTFHPTDESGNPLEKDRARASAAAVSMTKKPLDTVKICDANGTVINSLAAMLEELYCNSRAAGFTVFPVTLWMPLNTAKPLYICTDDVDYPMVQIGGLYSEVTKTRIGQEVAFDATLTHLLQFVTGSANYYVDSDFEIHEAGKPFRKVVPLQLPTEAEPVSFVFELSIPIRSVPRSAPRRRGGKLKEK